MPKNGIKTPDVFWNAYSYPKITIAPDKHILKETPECEPFISSISNTSRGPRHAECNYCAIYSILAPIYGMNLIAVDHLSAPSVVTRNEYRLNETMRFARRFHLFSDQSPQAAYLGIVHLRVLKKKETVPQIPWMIAEAFLSPPRYLQGKNFTIPLLDYYSTYLGLHPHLGIPYITQAAELGSVCSQSAIFMSLIMMAPYGANVIGPFDITAACLLYRLRQSGNRLPFRKRNGNVIELNVENNLPVISYDYYSERFYERDEIDSIRNEIERIKAVRDNRYKAKDGSSVVFQDDQFCIDGLFVLEIEAFFNSELSGLSGIMERPEYNDGNVDVVFSLLRSYLDSRLPIILTIHAKKMSEETHYAIKDIHSICLVGYGTPDERPYLIYQDSNRGPFIHEGARLLFEKAKYDSTDGKTRIVFVVPTPKRCNVTVSKIQGYSGHGRYSQKLRLLELLTFVFSSHDLSYRHNFVSRNFDERIVLIRSNSIIEAFFHTLSVEKQKEIKRFIEEKMIMPDYVWVQSWSYKLKDHIIEIVIYDPSRPELLSDETRRDLNSNQIDASRLRRIALIAHVRGTSYFYRPLSDYNWDRIIDIRNLPDVKREDVPSNKYKIGDLNSKKPELSVITSCIPEMQLDRLLLELKQGNIYKDIKFAELYVLREKDIETVQNNSTYNPNGIFDQLRENYKSMHNDLDFLSQCGEQHIRQLISFYRDQMQKHEIAAIGLATYIPEIAHKHHRDKVKVALNNLIQIAQELNCKFIELVCGGCILPKLEPDGQHQIVFTKDKDTEWLPRKSFQYFNPHDLLDHIIEFLEEVVEEGRKTYPNMPYFVLEAEPGPFYNLNSGDAILHYKEKIQEHNGEYARWIRLNLDMGHMMMLAKQYDNFNAKFFEDNHLIQFIGHAHISDNALGHFADLVPGSFHRIDRANSEEFTQWIDLYVKACQENRELCSNVVSIELESALGFQWIFNAFRKTKYMIDECIQWNSRNPPIV